MIPMPDWKCRIVQTQHYNYYYTSCLSSYLHRVKERAVNKKNIMISTLEEDS